MQGYGVRHMGSTVWFEGEWGGEGEREREREATKHTHWLRERGACGATPQDRGGVEC